MMVFKRGIVLKASYCRVILPYQPTLAKSSSAVSRTAWMALSGAVRIVFLVKHQSWHFQGVQEDMFDHLPFFIWSVVLSCFAFFSFAFIVLQHSLEKLWQVWNKIKKFCLSNSHPKKHPLKENKSSYMPAFSICFSCSVSGNPCRYFLPPASRLHLSAF